MNDLFGAFDLSRLNSAWGRQLYDLHDGLGAAVGHELPLAIDCFGAGQLASAAMKNIQVIDGAVNCVYDVFAATEEEFACIFQDGRDIAFSEDVWADGDEEELKRAFDGIWQRRVPKASVIGIHGTLFYEMPEKKQFYPTLKDEEAVNPGGSRLR